MAVTRATGPCLTKTLRIKGEQRVVHTKEPSDIRGVPSDNRNDSKSVAITELDREYSVPDGSYSALQFSLDEVKRCRR